MQSEQPDNQSYNKTLNIMRRLEEIEGVLSDSERWKIARMNTHIKDTDSGYRRYEGPQLTTDIFKHTSVVVLWFSYQP